MTATVLRLARSRIRENLFISCVVASILFHGICYFGYGWATRVRADDAVNSDTLNVKDVEVDFNDIPPELIGGDSSPAPVEKQEWVEGTNRSKDAKDAPDIDLDVNQLSGDGTDKDGYLYSFKGDRFPTPIIDFDLRRFFPSEAKRADIREKRVIVRVRVDADGTLQNARVVSPPAGYGFDDAAIRVVRMARFTPGYQKGRPVKMVHDLAIRFVLE